jgi:ferredoxin
MPDHHEVREGPRGLRFRAPADLPLLAAAERAGLEWPSSCRNGTCRTCMRQLERGQVTYRIEWPGLLAEEKARGWILPCVAYAASDLVLRDPAQADRAALPQALA